MERAENIDEYFVNHAKTESHAERVASPVKVKQGGITMPVCGKNYGKAHQLNEDVTEKELEFAVQSTLHHDGRDAQLQDRMCDPERIVQNFDFLAHLSGASLTRPCSPGKATQSVQQR